MLLKRWRRSLASTRTANRNRRNSRRRRLPATVSAIECLEDRILLSSDGAEVLYFSLAANSNDTSLPGVGEVSPSDIVRLDGETLTTFFRGSDVGLDTADIDAFAVVSETEILLSFASTVNISGLGDVSSSDVVLFTATSLGSTTEGSFSMFFDGSQVGLNPSASTNVDAIELLENGNLLISTAGDFTLSIDDGGESTVLNVRDEDLLEFTPDSVGAVTSGTWSVFLDGSDVDLTFGSEDIDAVSVGADGRIFLSTFGSFFVSGFGGDNEDVFEFVPATLGEDSSGGYVSPIFFNGSEVDPALVVSNVNAIDVHAAAADSVNHPPVAESQTVQTDEDASVTVQLSGDDGNDDADQALTFEIVSGPAHGSLVDFDPAGGTVTYIPDADYHGPDSFTFAVTDDESAGGDPLTSEPATVTLEVVAINDPPMITAPATEQVGDQNLELVIYGISVFDVDADEGNGILELQLSVNSGSISVTADHLGDDAVTGNGTSALVLRGTQSELNATLAEGVRYHGGLNFNGSETLTVTVSDLGNSGDGGPLTSTEQVGIRIRSVSEQIESLQDQITELIDSGQLSARHGHALSAKLGSSGGTSAAGRLGAFLNQTRALRRAGKLDADQASALIESAENILQSAAQGRSRPSAQRGLLNRIDRVFSAYAGFLDLLDNHSLHGQSRGQSGRGWNRTR